MGYSRKIQTGGIEDILFLKKKLWIFEVCHFTLGNYWQNKAFFTLGNSKVKNQDSWKCNMSFSWPPLKISLLPLEILDKTKLYFWKFCKIALYTLITPRNSTSFSGDPKNFNIVFLQYSGNSMFSTPLPLPLFGFLPLSVSLYITVYI